MASEAARVTVTSHARLRWLERVDAEEEYPAGAVRAAVERGVEFDTAGILGVNDEEEEKHSDKAVRVAVDRGVEFDTAGVLGVADETTGTVLICHDEPHERVVVTVLVAAVRYSGDELARGEA